MKMEQLSNNNGRTEQPRGRRQISSGNSEATYLCARGGGIGIEERHPDPIGGRRRRRGPTPLPQVSSGGLAQPAALIYAIPESWLSSWRIQRGYLFYTSVPLDIMSLYISRACF